LTNNAQTVEGTVPMRASETITSFIVHDRERFGDLLFYCLGIMHTTAHGHLTASAGLREGISVIRL
jgi:hypothetical protein